MAIVNNGALILTSMSSIRHCPATKETFWNIFTYWYSNTFLCFYPLEWIKLQLSDIKVPMLFHCVSFGPRVLMLSRFISNLTFSSFSAGKRLRIFHVSSIIFSFWVPPLAWWLSEVMCSAWHTVPSETSAPNMGGNWLMLQWFILELCLLMFLFLAKCYSNLPLPFADYSTQLTTENLHCYYPRRTIY